MSAPQFSPAEWSLVCGIVGKLFIELADSMPAPPDKCGYWKRWAFDFMQRLASNGSKVGTTRNG